MLFHKSKKNQPSLDEETAAVMLGNIFDACEKEPNSVPLSVLASYSNYRKERFILQKILLVLVFLLFFLVPFLFIPPVFSVETVTTSGRYDPVYEVTVKTPLIPVDRVTATLGGHNVPVYETANHVYQVEPDANGELVISVVLANHQTNQQTIVISDVDTKAPVLLSNKQEDDTIVLVAEDADSGIDYSGIYALNTQGERIQPLSYDEGTGKIVFTYPEEALNIYIPDKADNVLHLILSLY